MMIADEQINGLNEPCAGFQVREITDENVSAFELKLITRPINVENCGTVKAACVAERAALCPPRRNGRGIHRLHETGPNRPPCPDLGKVTIGDDPHTEKKSRNTSA